MRFVFVLMTIQPFLFASAMREIEYRNPKQAQINNSSHQDAKKAKKPLLTGENRGNGVF